MFDDIPALLPDLREFYEDLHRHPELSFAEVRTSGIMAQRLRDLGYEVTAEVGRTGVVATLDNGDGPTVLLRADIDALPVKEDTGLSYASTATGIDADGAEVPVAHACGHDMHATWMIGVATQLATHRNLWSGKVILAVQPAEEIGGGANAMIDDGLFERFGTPDVALGQHVTPAPAGWVLFRPGAVMTASDALKIVMHGRGAHGSAPEQSVDPVVMAASTIMKLQTVVSRNIAATDSAVVTVGTVRAGTKENIISDHAELTLSVRTFEPAVRDKVLAAISRIAHGEAHSCGAEQPPDITTLYSFPAVTNDAATTATVGAAFVEHFGADRAMEGPVATASEDFGLFGSRGGFPSMFWFIGGSDPVVFQEALAANRINEDIPFNHSPRYAPIQDPTITTGIEAMLVAAMCWLAPDPVA
jgi:hippurate hydrolase